MKVLSLTSIKLKCIPHTGKKNERQKGSRSLDWAVKGSCALLPRICGNQAYRDRVHGEFKVNRTTIPTPTHPHLSLLWHSI